MLIIHRAAWAKKPCALLRLRPVRTPFNKTLYLATHFPVIRKEIFSPEQLRHLSHNAGADALGEG